jgi:hypothetical protein
MCDQQHTTCNTAATDTRSSFLWSPAVLSYVFAAVAARGAEPTSNAGPSNAAAAAAGGSGVKRERDAGDDEDWEEGYGVPRSATAAVDIDLTDEVS